MIGDHDEHPGTQREDPSAFTNDEFGDGTMEAQHVRQASRTQRLSVRAKNELPSDNGNQPRARDGTDQSQPAENSPSTIGQNQTPESPQTKADSTIMMFEKGPAKKEGDAQLNQQN